MALIPISQLPALPPVEAIQAEQARRSLKFFVELAWPVVEPGAPFVPGWHLDAICAHLEAVLKLLIRALIISVPPRHAKSTLTNVLFPAWAWISHPHLKWLFAAYAASLSTRDSVRCRRLIESNWYQSRWGHVFGLAADQNLKARFDNTQGGYRIATSVGGSITGEGADLLVADDPHNVAEIHSQASREGVVSWYREVMSTRLHDPRTGCKLIVAHRTHEADLIGHLLEEGGWEHLCLPAEYEPGRHCATSIGWEDPRTVPDEPLWPGRFGEDELDQLKRSLGAYAAAAQLQQRPAPADGGVFNPSWWRHYRASDLPSEFEEMLVSWDFSFKATRTGSFVVGQVWGRLGARFYLLDQVRGRWEYAACRQKVTELCGRWPDVFLVLIEEKANGAAILSDLGDQIPGLVPVNPQGSKEARARAVSPLVEAGNVYLPDPRDVPWVNALLGELAAFPNAAHDDQVDALSQALERMREGSIAPCGASLQPEEFDQDPADESWWQRPRLWQRPWSRGDLGAGLHGYQRLSLVGESSPFNSRYEV